jgi:ABC-type uncharacterized transport system substrate-binding protein
MVVRLLRALLLIFALLPDAWAGGTVLLFAEDNNTHTEFAGNLLDSLRTSSWSIERAEGIGKPDLIVACGSESFRKALANASNVPVIAALIQRPAYEKILAEAPRNRPRSTAVFLEQPLARQAAFIRQLLPGLTRVGLLLRSDGRAAQAAAYQQSLGHAGLTVENEPVDNENELLPALNALLPRSSLLLATPDGDIYRRETIRAILVTSYRYQKPVIAYSPGFVQAGALAAIYATPAQIGRQVGEMITNLGSTLPPPREPNQFTIAINRNVAQALNLNLPDEAVLRRTLNEREGR